MSFILNLYRAPDGLPPMQEWEEEHRDPLGSLEEVHDRFAALYPTLRWQQQPDGSMLAGLSRDETAEYGFVVSLRQLDGQIYDIALWNSPSPSHVRAICRAFDLNYCCLSGMFLRDPHGVDEYWQPV